MSMGDIFFWIGVVFGVLFMLVLLLFATVAIYLCLKETWKE